MRRQLALVAGAAGGAVVAFLLRRRPTEPGAAPAPVETDAREDLRRKLAEAREATATEEEFEVAGMSAETVVEIDGREADDVDAARRRVHDEARATVESMKRDDDSPGEL